MQQEPKELAETNDELRERVNELIPDFDAYAAAHYGLSVAEYRHALAKPLAVKQVIESGYEPRITPLWFRDQVLIRGAGILGIHVPDPRS
ncbi:MAG: hypothetical protein AAFX06_10190 [Planctomycetota bacterium]